MEEADLASLAGGILLLLLTGLLAGFETALAGSHRPRIKEIVGDNSSRGWTYDFLLFEQSKVISLTGFWKFVLVVLLTGLTVSRGFVGIGMTVQVLLYSLLIVVLLVILVSFIFRHFASKRPEKYLISLYPLAYLIAQSLRLWDRLLKGDSKEKKNGRDKEDDFSSSLTEENIRMMVTAGQEHGFLEEEEGEMIHSIFEFGDTIAREVMVPRVDMICVEADTPISEAVGVFLKYGFSRLPVYEGNIDNIIGIANLKDLVKVLHENKPDTGLRSLLRPAFFVPGNKKIDELLREMQAGKQQIAVVVDEYGGTDGLITTEDIVEEIVGEIIDEYDRETPPIEQVENMRWLVDAGTVIEDVNDEIGTDLPATEEYETIGGYVYGLLGHVPREGETIRSDGLKITVEKVQRHRIKRLSIEKINEAGKTGPEPEKVES